MKVKFNKETFYQFFHSFRFQLAIRYALGFIIPLAITFADFYESKVKVLIPIFYALFIALVPPYQASCTLCLGLLFTGCIPAIGFGTAALAATIATGEEWAGFLVLIGTCFFACPLVVGKLAAASKMFFIAWVLLASYVFLLLEDLSLTGQLLYLPLPNLCGYNEPGKQVMNIVANVSCAITQSSQVFQICRPWPTELVALSPDYSFVNRYFDGETLCITEQSGYVTVSISPGNWILEVIWTENHGEFAIMLGIISAFAIAVACVCFALLIIPPTRLVKNKFREEIVTEIHKYAMVVNSLTDSPELDEKVNNYENNEQTSKIQVDGDRKSDSISDQNRLKMLEQLFLFCAFEPHLVGTGITIAYWPKLKNIVENLHNVRGSLSVFLDRSEKEQIDCSNKSSKQKQLDQLMQSIQSLLKFDAYLYSILPTPNKECQFEIQRHINEESGKKIIELNAAYQNFLRSLSSSSLSSSSSSSTPESSASVVRPSHYFLLSLDMLITDTLKFNKESVELVTLETTPAAKNILISLLGLSLGIFVPLFSLGLAVASMINYTKLNCFGRPKGSQNAEILSCNDKNLSGTWKKKELLYVFQFLVAFAIILFPPIFFVDLRNWLLNPVGVLPTGKFGLWIVLPVMVLVLPTREGTASKAMLRVVGTLFGVFFGYTAALVLQKSLVGGCVYLTLIVFMLVSIGVHSRGNITQFGSFNNSWGYAVQLCMYTSVIVSVEAVFSCSEVANPNSTCHFTAEDVATVRVCGQLLGVIVSILVTNFVFPRNGSLIAREDLGQALLYMTLSMTVLFSEFHDQNCSKSNYASLAPSSSRYALSKPSKVSPSSVVDVYRDYSESGEKPAKVDTEEISTNKNRYEDVIHLLNLGKEKVKKSQMYFTNTTIFSELPLWRSEKSINHAFVFIDNIYWRLMTLLYSLNINDINANNNFNLPIVDCNDNVEEKNKREKMEKEDNNNHQEEEKDINDDTNGFASNSNDKNNTSNDNNSNVDGNSDHGESREDPRKYAGKGLGVPPTSPHPIDTSLTKAPVVTFICESVTQLLNLMCQLVSTSPDKPYWMKYYYFLEKKKRPRKHEVIPKLKDFAEKIAKDIRDFPQQHQEMSQEMSLLLNIISDIKDICVAHTNQHENSWKGEESSK